MQEQKKIKIQCWGIEVKNFGTLSDDVYVSNNKITFFTLLTRSHTYPKKKREDIIKEKV